MKVPLFPALLVAVFLAGAPAQRIAAEEVRPDPSAKATIFLPFEFYGRNREELGLNADQVREMERLAESVREPAQKLESERTKRNKALLEVMAQSPIDADAAMARFQAVLEAENESKTLQFRAGIVMRNTLSSDQLLKLKELATKGGGARLTGGPAIIHDRIQQLRAELHKRNAGEPPRAVMAQLKQIEQTAREGRTGEAKTQLEELLKQLRQESEPSPKSETKTPSSAKDSSR
jgi:hypothetical protein